MTRLLILGLSLLGSGLLLLVLVLVAGVSGQGALEDLENLLILDLLVGLELGQIRGGGGRQFGDTVLGDSCDLR